MRGLLKPNGLMKLAQEMMVKIGTTALCRKLLPTGFILRRKIDTEEN